MSTTLEHVEIEDEIDEDEAAKVFGTALYYLLGINEGVTIDYNDEKVIVHKCVDPDGHGRINIDYFEEAIGLDEGQLVMLQYDNDDQVEEEDSIVTIIPINMNNDYTVH